MVVSDAIRILTSRVLPKQNELSLSPVIGGSEVSRMAIRVILDLCREGRGDSAAKHR